MTIAGDAVEEFYMFLDGDFDALVIAPRGGSFAGAFATYGKPRLRFDSVLAAFRERYGEPTFRVKTKSRGTPPSENIKTTAICKSDAIVIELCGMNGNFDRARIATAKWLAAVDALKNRTKKTTPF